MTRAKNNRMSKYAARKNLNSAIKFPEIGDETQSILLLMCMACNVLDDNVQQCVTLKMKKHLLQI